jgi:hypothetical protein
VTTQPIKPTKLPLKYPYIIYSSSKHCAPNCPKHIEVQNMFQIKPTITTTIVAKNPKPNNVPINVIVVVMTHNQVPEQ